MSTDAYSTLKSSAMDVATVYTYYGNTNREHKPEGASPKMRNSNRRVYLNWVLTNEELVS